MNKRIVSLLSVMLLALPGCNGGKGDPEIPQEGVKLEVDKSTQYDFSKTASNVNGSGSYEIFVRSFYDTDGNGIGDFNGVTQKLDYLESMGIKTLWLMPIMPSPSYHGYDVTNYFAVNSDFGTMADFENMVKKAEEHHIDIMIDMVLNHCSIMNSYFVQGLADYKNNNTAPGSKKDWFNFSDSYGDHVKDGVYYESKFDASMPDFNLDNQEVRDEIENITKFWIEKGVKGFRLDAVLYYYYNQTSLNVEFLTWLEETAHKYDENFYMVGECWQGNQTVNSYYASKCDSFFRFDNSVTGERTFNNIVKGRGSGDSFADFIQKHETAMKNRNPNGYSSFFLSNHDQDRVSKNFDPEQNKLGANFYLLLPGTPFMYYGEEISMVGVRSTGPDDLSDVKRRLPMVWSKDDKTGQCTFPEKNRRDLDNTVQVELGVEDQLKEPFSLVNHYRYVMGIRNKYPFLKQARFQNLTPSLNSEENAVMAYKLYLGNEYIYVVHNFTDINIEVDAPGTEITDMINNIHLLPKLENGKLSIAAKSTVIMK